ncbi:hypothetical protein TNCV_4440291, partial [Trichonephila clavipes]
EYFVTAGVVILDRGLCLVSPARHHKRMWVECGREVGENILWAGGVVVVLGDGGHVLVLRSCATKECEWNAEGVGGK